MKAVPQPPIVRGSMVSEAWAGPLWRRWGGARPDAAPPLHDAPGDDRRPLRLRRVLLLLLIVAGAAVGTRAMVKILPDHGATLVEQAILVLFGILFAWISAGFWTAAMGAWVLLRGRDPDAVTNALHSLDAAAPLPEGARTAVIMPICNEHVATVFAGLRATVESLAATGQLDRFDFFVLSDTNRPDVRAREQAAWSALTDTLRDAGIDARVYDRWRLHRTKRKAGNVADFCRRWGRRYRYMVVFDADSVMSGDCLVRMVQLMEARPDAGIVQTAPRASGHVTLHARVQQFGARLYGPLFTAGMHYWQLGESHYWGHNAIIRIAPFMQHCGLAPIPGRGSLSGEVMSHDFVEAALMRRAGWKVWIAYDLDGSYEQFPPNLVSELQRDRRWCHGNLQNARLMAEPGLLAVHRWMFLSGVMAYLSAPLWLGFLVLSTALFADHAGDVPQYFIEAYQLFPIWPSVDLRLIITLFSLTAALLLAPKAFALAVVLLKGQRRDYGGAMRLFASAFVEMLHSMLLAPVRMLFHTQFVLAALTGWKLEWKSPPRDDAATGWREAWRRHGVHSLLALLWIAALLASGAVFPWWLSPILAGLLVGVPFSVWSSRVRLGRWLRALGLFTIPEERRVPKVLAEARRHARAAEAADMQAGGAVGFVAAAADAEVLEKVVAACPPRPPAAGRKGAAQRLRVQRVAAALSKADPGDRLRLLASAEGLRALHRALTPHDAAGAVAARPDAGAADAVRHDAATDDAAPALSAP